MEDVEVDEFGQTEKDKDTYFMNAKPEKVKPMGADSRVVTTRVFGARTGCKDRNQSLPDDPVRWLIR